MYRQASELHFGASCSVGFKSALDQGKVYGRGCSISPKLVLTAQHCIKVEGTASEYPIAVVGDSLFMCEIVYESYEQDICLLLLKTEMEKKEYDLKLSIAPLSFEKISIGSSVGFISSLTLLNNLGESESKTMLATAHVAMFHKNAKRDGFRLGLTPTVVQQGFSGSAVFIPSGQIVGVMTEVLSFATEISDSHVLRNTVPVISPLFVAEFEIKHVLQQVKEQLPTQ